MAIEIVDVLIKNGDLPYSYVSSPEGMLKVGVTLIKLGHQAGLGAG